MLFGGLPALVFSQPHAGIPDSLHSELQQATNDTLRMELYDQLAYYYSDANSDSALFYNEKALPIARRLGLKMQEASTLTGIGFNLMNLMNYPGSLTAMLQARQLLEDPRNEQAMRHLPRMAPHEVRLGLLSQNQLILALLYYVDIQQYDAGNRDKMMESFRQSKNCAEAIGDTAAIGFVHWLMGRECTDRNRLDSARLLLQMALDCFEKSDITHTDRRYTPRSYKGLVYSTLGTVYWSQGFLDSAYIAFRKGEAINREKNHLSGLYSAYADLSDLFLSTDQPDSSLAYARKALAVATITHSFWGKSSSYRNMAAVYAKQMAFDSAYFYLQRSSSLRDSLNFERTKQILGFQHSFFNEQLRFRQLDAERVNTVNTLRLTVLVAGIAAAALMAFLFYRNSRNRKKTNAILLQKNRENEQQKKDLEEALSTLKNTQAQLVEKELAELNQKATELEMQAFRAQMNPHFIFNSLNSINRFILQNNKTQASEYLTKFSKLVRMILQHSQEPLITLENELESLKLYLALEALRFNYHFTHKISVAPELDIEVVKVPPLIIQPYAENAIWHGLMHKEEPGRLDIEISEQNDYLTIKVSDDGIGRQAAAALSGKAETRHPSMGLKITAARIANYMPASDKDAPVSFIDLHHPDGSGAGTEVIIKIPVMYD